MIRRYGIDRLVGKKILAVYMNKRQLRFDTIDGPLCFEPEGDCCSETVFWDFYGIPNLIHNGPVLSVHHIDDYGRERDFDKPMTDYDDVVRNYGVKFVTESPEFGEMTSVLAYRNNSNGYYGGSIRDTAMTEVSPRVFVDVIEAEDQARS